MLKAVYGRRSDLVHGTGKGTKAFYNIDGNPIRTSTLAVILLRKLLLSQFTNDPAWSIKDLDDDLLRSLNRGRNGLSANAQEEASADDERSRTP